MVSALGAFAGQTITTLSLDLHESTAESISQELLDLFDFPSLKRLAHLFFQSNSSGDGAVRTARGDALLKQWEKRGVRIEFRMRN